MRKFGKESAAPGQTGADRENSGAGWLKDHWCVLVLCVSLIVAFALRTVFAYGISVDGDYALSGGSSAQYHLHVIESIMNGSYSLTDSAVNYPYGGLALYPPLLDFICAGIGSVLSAFGLSTAEAAAASVAVFNPIIGALTCIPVYLLAKEMFDKKVGAIAALVFAFLALPISTTVFSSGTEYGLAAFLLAFMSLFVVKMVKAVDAAEPSRKSILVNAAIAGVFLLLSALTWNGFRFVVVLLVVAMVLQILADRFRGRDFTDVLLGYATTIAIGTIVPAAYYIPAGLWDAVFSGPFLIAVVAIALSFAFLMLRAKPWIVTIPSLVVVFVAICAVMAFAAPDMLDDFIFGNSIYSSSIMEHLASSHVSISNVSSYYGWLTMWLPICFAIYSTYVYLRKDHSATQLLTTVWMFVMFFAVWTSSANAAVVGSVFAIGSAVVIVRVIQAADLRAWWTSMKVAGFPGLFRKMIKPLPFVSVVVTALLIVVPNVSFAVDAGIPSNSDADYYFSGNTSFTIKTGDSYNAEKVWNHYADIDKTGALAAWIDYSYDAVNHGGFDSVTDTIGGGSTAVAQMLLAKGAAGTTAASMMRIILAHDIKDFSSAFSAHSDVYSKISSYIEDPSSAAEAIDADPATYGKVRADITDENAVYLASIEAMTSSMSTPDIMNAYDAVCDIAGDKVSYYLLDSSLLPLQYNDGDYFSTLAYFADYTVDKYGAASQYYSYNTYYGYTSYTDAIYETFLWRAMIGPSATEAGYSSSYSYLVALASSDGSKSSAMAVPGYGLAGYTVGFWQVKYNPDSTATASSDGWAYMDGYEAIAKQKTDGGVINYLSSIVMLEYVGASQASETTSGTVTADSKNVDGATVSIYTYNETYGRYILYSQAKTINGSYTAFVPSGDYTVTVSVGGVDLQSYKSGSIPEKIEIETTDISGSVKVEDEIYSAEKMRLDLVGSASVGGDSKTISISVVNGLFSQSSVLPGKYSYTLYSETGTSMGTGTVTLASGSTDGFVIVPTTKTITVTVNDQYGNSVDDDEIVVVATNTVTGAQFTASINDEGKAVITAVPGKYNISVGQGMVSLYSSTSDISSGNRTATVTAYNAQTVSISGATEGVFSVYAGEFSTTTYVNGGSLMFDVPVGLATGSVQYTIYGIYNGSVYHGTYTDGTSASVESGSYTTVSGTLKNGDDSSTGTIRFISEANEVFIVSTNSDGKYTVALPGGSYTIYADNGSNKVCFESGYTASTDDKDLSLVDGRKITYTLRYATGTSSANSYLPFVKSIMKFNYNDHDYTLYGMSNTSGASVFYIPDNVESTVAYNNEDGTMDNDCFSCTEIKKTISAGTANNSSTTTIEVHDSSKTEQKNIVKEVSVEIPYDMELKFYSDDSDKRVKYSAGTTQTLRPGQYTVTIEGTSGHYFSGTAYIRPGDTMFTGLDSDDVQEVAIVTITKADTDKVTITTEDGSYHAFTDGYYFEVGYKYYLTSVNTVNGKDTIAYGYLDLTDATAGSTETINVTASQEKIEVTGNVGIVADGTITVTYTANGKEVKHDFDVSKGGYTLALPSGTGSVTVDADVTMTVDKEDYKYAASATISDLRDGVVRNISVITNDDDSGDDDDDDDDDDDVFEASIASAAFSNGTGSFTVSVKNLTKGQMTFVFTAGSALSFAKVYSLVVPAESTGTVTIDAIYDHHRYAPGSDGFSVTVSDINAKQTETVRIETGDDRTGSSDITAYKMGQDGSKFNDKVSAYQYLYAITFDNKNTYSHDVSINVSGVDSSWAVTIVDENGTNVLLAGETFKVYGLQTTVLYVKVMLLNADKGASASVPTITASISIDGSSSSMTIEPQTAEVSTGDMSASGTDIYNERSGIPSGIWFFVAVIILLIVAVAWLASKRGVFARRS